MVEKKIRTVLESLEFDNYFNVCLNKFKNNQNLFDKIGLQFLEMTKLFTCIKHPPMCCIL
jgi:hypothetical protein